MHPDGSMADVGELATSYGSDRLTHHLLEAVVATLTDVDIGTADGGLPAS